MIVKRKLFHIPEKGDCTPSPYYYKPKLTKTGKRYKGKPKITQGNSINYEHIKLVRELGLNKDNIDGSIFENDQLIRAAAIRYGILEHDKEKEKNK